MQVGREWRTCIAILHSLMHPTVPLISLLKTWARLVSAVMKSLIDRKSTRLNSSHQIISYAVFCLKKKTVPAQAPKLIFAAHVTIASSDAIPCPSPGAGRRMPLVATTDTRPRATLLDPDLR